MQTWPEIAHSFEERFLGLFNLVLNIRRCRKAFFLLLLPEYLTSHTYFRIQVSFKEMKRFGDQGWKKQWEAILKKRVLKLYLKLKWRDLPAGTERAFSRLEASTILKCMRGGKLSGCALWISLRLLIQAHCCWAAQLFCEWVAREVSLSNERNC